MLCPKNTSADQFSSVHLPAAIIAVPLLLFAGYVWHEKAEHMKQAAADVPAAVQPVQEPKAPQRPIRKGRDVLGGAALYFSQRRP